MLKPKRSKGYLKETASRQFTDRELPRQAFRKSFELINNEDYKVLVYYGIGGIGKSRLLKELYLLTNLLDSSAVKVSIDFREIAHREQSEALIWFKQHLTKDYNIKFTTFDLAYAIYWSKMNPHISLKSEGISIPFFEEGNFIGDLIYELCDFPVVQWIPKTLKLIESLAQSKEIIKWWKKTGKEVMSELKEMYPRDIEEMLLVYWADDFNEWLKTSNRKAVFFFDTYEALWENDRSKGSFGDKDEWIREFILQFNESKVLNVICGREKLTWVNENPEWDQVVEQHLIGELSAPDCINFLQSCNITDEKIQEIIIQGSKGLPYYLDLMVDTYQLVSKKRKPTVEDFSRTPSEVLQRFLKYLDRPEKETLKVLSVPRFWSEHLFVDLITEFKTFYPPTSYSELCHFSFIQETDKSGNWMMHKIMKSALFEQNMNTSPNLVGKINKFLFDYYSEKLLNRDSDIDLCTSFVEGLYHGEDILDDDELIEWISKNSIILINEGKWSCLIQEFLRILGKETLSKKLLAFINLKLAKLYLLKGQYRFAEKSSLDALQYYLEMLSLQPSSVIFKKLAEIQNQLGELYRNTNEYEKGIQAYTNAIAYLEKISEDDLKKWNDIALACTKLGKLYKLRSCYIDAKHYYEKALETCNNVLNLGVKSSLIYAVLGEVHEKLGELMHDELYGNPKNDLSHFYLSIEAYNRALEDNELENYLSVLTNLGLAHKRLAEAYSIDNHTAEKISHFNNSINIYNDVIQFAPDYVDGYEKRGHAAADFMALQIEIGMYDEALETFNLAIESFENAIKLSEKQGSSLNRIGSAYRTLGKLHRKQKNFALAIVAFETAIQKSDELMHSVPEYIYAHNSRGKTYKELGECYGEMGNEINYVTYTKLAISCFENTLKNSPNSKTALNYLEKLKNNLKQIN